MAKLRNRKNKTPAVETAPQQAEANKKDEANKKTSMWPQLVSMLVSLSFVFTTRYFDDSHLHLIQDRIKVKEVNVSEFTSLNEVVRGKMPVVLKNSPTSASALTEKWSNEYLVQSVDQDIMVKSNKDGNFMHFDTTLPFASDFAKPYDEQLMSMASFLQHAGNDSEDAGYYMNDEVEHISKQLTSDVSIFSDLLVVNDPPFESLAGDTVEKMTKLWIGGSAGTVANLHYDATHNFFHQVRGSKTFLLFEPSTWKHMCMYSRLHPGHRQSKLNLAHTYATLLPMCNDLYNVRHVRKVTLHQGDTLYLPPFWFHQVTTVESPAVSVNVWSNSADLNNLQHALQNPMPYVPSFESEKLIVDAESHLFALQEFLRQLIHKSFDENESKQFIPLLLKNAKASSSDEYKCATSTQSDLISKAMSAHVDAIYSKSFALMHSDVRLILLSSFIESLASEIVQPTHAHSFLNSCI